MSHFTPDCGANKTVLPASSKQFLQYKLNGMPLLMRVLFIPIVWFTFQYNFIHYAQLFQELHWVLALSVSLCPTLSYMLLDAIIGFKWSRWTIPDDCYIINWIFVNMIIFLSKFTESCINHTFIIEWRKLFILWAALAWFQE